ncbi:MAG: type II toxin-antitoxin system RelE/ParE family toxin [Alphaproteobacteria bacterium]
MPRWIVFTPAARVDLLDALDWYSAHAPGTVSRIRAELRELSGRIAANPLQFPTGAKNTHRALLRHFPYVVIFQFTDEAVHIIAFFHTGRDPRQWQRRTV